MTPLPGALNGNDLVVWRLERTAYFSTWEQAEGAFRVGGRWSSPRRRVIYASIDPATTIVEVAVHKGFNVLDMVPHTLIALDIKVPAAVHIVLPDHIPNRNWLSPGTVSSNQQSFGDELLDKYPMVAVPSVVSTHSWNLLINVETSVGMFALRHSEPFALDTRLTPGVHAKKR